MNSPCENIPLLPVPAVSGFPYKSDIRNCKNNFYPLVLSLYSILVPNFSVINNMYIPKLSVN